MNRKNEEDFFLFSWKKFLLSRIYNGETFDNKVYNDPVPFEKRNGNRREYFDGKEFVNREAGVSD